MRADRLLSLILLLQSRGKLTAQTLAHELEVSPRTILRDVDALSIAGIPIYAEGGHGGGITLDENYRVTLNGLKEAEVRSLFISGNATLLRDVGLGDAAESTLLKLFSALPAVYQPSVEHIRQRILIDPLWWWHTSMPLPFWEQLQQGVYEDRRIQAVYENFNGDLSERVLEPYSLVAKSSLWYLIAERDADLRIYRVSRFHEVILLSDHFHRDESFDLPTYWYSHVEEFIASASEYAFTLKVHPSRLNFVQGLTIGRHEIVEPSEGEDWLTIKIRYDSLDLAKMLVLGLGAQAIIVEPRELRQAVLDTAREIVNRDG